MQLSILQEDLANSVLLASRFISTRAQLPILSNILLTAKAGKLSLSATNLETGVYTFVGAKIEKEGSITIPAKILVDIITHLPAGKVDMRLEKDQLRISCNSFSATLAGIPAHEFPNVPDRAEEKTFSCEAEILRTLNKQVAFAAATDDLRPILTGICLTVDDQVVAVATDGFRMSHKQLEGKTIHGLSSKKTKLLLPARVIDELNRALGGKSAEIVVAVKDKEGQVVFSADSIVMATRLLEGEFPDFNKVLPKEWTTRVILGKDELSQAVKAASVFARESASVVKIKFEKDKVTIFAESNVYGKEEVSVEAKLEGEETTSAFNYRYLLEFLSSVSGETISIETKGPTTPGVFQDTNDPTYKHIIMPVRVQG